jgi:D-3-phosphoglycerate dehydrogenase / 2-oxoglutarate reductase
MKILHLDKNHPLFLEQLAQLGFQNDEDYTSSKQEVEAKITTMKVLSFVVGLTLTKPFWMPQKT